jgi:hypothetical protein
MARDYGTELLEAIRKAKRPTAVFMRHAPRPPVVDLAQSPSVELTALGREAAEAFGAELAGLCAVRIFHSPILRCAQTAAHIALGTRAAGVATEVLGARPELGASYLVDAGEVIRLGNALGRAFVRQWFAGEIGEAVIRPAAAVLAEYLGYLARELGDGTASDRVDLHVTHDWNVLLLREGTLGLRHEEAGWIDYLDGLLVEPHEDALRVGYREREAMVKPA